MTVEEKQKRCDIHYHEFLPVVNTLYTSHIQHSKFWVLTFQNTPPHFKTLIFFPEPKSDLFKIPPWKLKFRQILALWVFTFQNTSSPPKNWNWGKCLHFGFWLSRTPPTHPKFQNSNFLCWAQIWPFPECAPPCFSGSWSIWRLIAVSAKDTISLKCWWLMVFLHCMVSGPGQVQGKFELVWEINRDQDPLFPIVPDQFSVLVLDLSPCSVNKPPMSTFSLVFWWIKFHWHSHGPL